MRGMASQMDRTPRWVKVFGAVVVLIVVLLVIVLVVRGPGGHGPGRHAPSRDSTPPRDTGGHEPPTGSHTQP